VLRLAGAAAARARAEVVPVAGEAFERAWRVAVTERPANEYQVQLVAPVKAALKQGEVVLLTVYARMVSTGDESGEGRVGLVLEQVGEPYGRVFARSFGVGRAWTRLDVPAVVNVDFSKVGAQVTVRLGAFPQTVEVGGVELKRMPAGVKVADLPQTAITYTGRSPDAAWRAEAAERIEKIRKAPLTVRVKDEAGKPIAGASVSVRMVRQAFAFGSCYNIQRFTGATADTADSRMYRERFAEMFNTAVDEYAMKWPAWDDASLHARAIETMGWMREHDIAVRGHCLVWPSWKHSPAGLQALAGDKAALRERLAARMGQARELAGQVVDWDVVNEPNQNHDLLDVLGEEAMVDWFKRAAEADPRAALYLNETGVPNSPPRDARYDVLYRQVEMLLKHGAPVGGVGMQAHVGMTLNSPGELMGIYDRFAKLGVPTRITELDVDVADEQLQADYFRDFLTISYSHPNVNGILIWGFWEGQHWRPHGALYRKDWSIKPAGKVWQELVLKQWRTNVEGVAGTEGEYRVRAFLGDYEVVVRQGERTKTVRVTVPAAGAVADVGL
jgi:GH35 family endo-1,4-beta-xylanase